MVVFPALSLDFLKRNFPRLYEAAHLNLLRGQLNLQDVDLPPTDPFTLFSYPLQIASGNVSSLMLHVPWTQITTSPIRVSARHVHVDLVEPVDSHQSSVFPVLLRDALQQKKRHIVDAEEAITPLLRACRKLLPLMLHRVELDIRDIQLTVQFSNNYVLRLALAALTTSAPLSSTADLAKSFVLESLSIDVSASPSHPLSIQLPHVAVALTVANARYDLDVTVPLKISVHVHASLAAFLHYLSARRRRWQLAATYARPEQTVSDAPAEWFQYAYRVAKATATSSRPLSSQFVRGTILACIQYERLHVSRLRRELRPGDESMLNDLERRLTAEMILLLHAHARKHVLAEQVSTFATNHWLHWTLFSNDMSKEREVIASDIRASLAAVERGDVEAPELDQVANCTRARFSVALVNLETVVSGIVEDVRLYVVNSVLQAEVETSLDSFSISASIGGAGVLMGGFPILRQGLFDGDVADQVDDNSPLIEFRANKPALDERTNAELCATAVSIVVDLHTISKVLRIVRMLCMDRASLMRIGQFHDLQPQKAVDRKSRSSFQIVGSLCSIARLTQVDVLITDGSDLSTDSTKEHFGVLVCFKGVDLRAIIPHDGLYELHAGTFLSADSCTFVQRRIAEGDIAVERRERSLRPLMCDVFNAAAHLSATYEKNLLSFSVDGLKSTLVAVKAGFLVDLFSSAMALSQEIAGWTLPSLGSNSSLVFETESHQERTPVPSSQSPASPWRLSLTSAVLHVRSSDDVKQAERDILLKASDIQVTSSVSGLSASLNKASLKEMKHGGEVTIRPVKGMQHGAIVAISTSLSVPSVDVSTGDVNISISVPSIFVASRVISTVSILVKNMGNVLAGPIYNEAVTVNTKAPRFSLVSKSVHLELTSPYRLTASLKQAFFVVEGRVWNCSFDRIELTDAGGPSRKCEVILPVSELGEGQAISDERALSLNAGPGFVNINLVSLQVALFRSFLSHLEHLFEILSPLFHPAMTEGHKGQMECTEPVGVPKREAVKVSVQGSKLTLDFVFETSLEERVRLDIPHVTGVFSSASQLLSLRRLSVLTTTRPGKDDRPLNSSVRCHEEQSSVHWSVLLRHLDADFSHHNSISLSSPSESSGSHRHRWSITILSRVAVYLAPSQVHTISNVISEISGTDDDCATALLSDCDDPCAEDSNHFSNSDRSPSSSEFASFSRTSIHCETQALSLELLKETSGGSVSSSIASLELDPASFSVTVAKEMSKERKQTTVTTWEGTCPSFRIEDRDVFVPPSRHVVIETEESWVGMRGPTSSIAQDGDVGMGLLFNGITRTHDQKTTSSQEIHLKRARVVLSSCLYMSLIEFCEQCSVGTRRSAGNDRFGDQPDQLRKGVPYDKGKATRGAIASKISLHLDEPIVLLFSVKHELRNCALESRAKSIKASLLFSDRGELLDGSVVKIKRVRVFLMWMSEFKRTVKGPSLSASLVNVNDVLDFRGVESLDGSASQSPSSIPYSSESFRGSLRPTLESILGMNTVNVRLPVTGRKFFSISVPDAFVESSIQTLTNALILVASLDVGIPEDNNAPIACPEFRVSVNSLSATVSVPIVRETSSAALFRNDHLSLRLNVTTDVIVSEDVESVSGTLKVSADVMDYHRNIHDHLVSPTSVYIKVRAMGRLSVDIWTDQFIRLTLSPLTARTVSRIISLFSQTDQKETESSGGGERVSRDACAAGNDLGMSGSVRMSIKGIIVYGLAEEPRIQLLRVVLRDVNVVAIMPMGANEDGLLEFSLQDFLVEDTISWRFPWRAGERSGNVDWGKIMAGSHGQVMHDQTEWLSPTVHNAMPSIHERSGAFGGSTISPFANEFIKQSALPLATYVVKWTSPLEQVSAHLRVRGIDFNIDMAIISSILEWSRSIAVELEMPKAPVKRTDVLNMRVDQFIIEPVTVNLSMRAPPKLLQPGLIAWLLGNVMGSDWTRGVEIEFPRVVINGDFFGMEGMLEKIEMMYLQKLSSRYFLSQILWQLPQFAGLARVLGTSLVRRRGHILINRVESSAFSKRRVDAARQGVGLLGLLRNDSAVVGRLEHASWQTFASPSVALVNGEQGEGGKDNCISRVDSFNSSTDSAHSLHVVDITNGDDG